MNAAKFHTHTTDGDGNDDDGDDHEERIVNKAPNAKSYAR